MVLEPEREKQEERYTGVERPLFDFVSEGWL
ncbi:MAG: hypothetical protein PWQ79_1351 [Thermococcaceae archaeon]|nr:hypothetical protein [Thermococcaceae archaeon]MDK2914436.1 hypothetical protein [Thermococcaceae archaeon]